MILVYPIKVHMSTLHFFPVLSEILVNEHPRPCLSAEGGRGLCREPWSRMKAAGFLSISLRKWFQICFQSCWNLYFLQPFSTEGKGWNVHQIDGWFLILSVFGFIIHFKAMWLDMYPFRIVFSSQGTLSFIITHWSSLCLMLFGGGEA